MLLASFDNSPDIIGTTESNLLDKDVYITSVDLDISVSVHTPTKAKKGCALMYIKSSFKLKYQN